MDTGPVHRHGPDPDAPGVRITSDDDGAVLHIVVHGRWNWDIALAVRTAVNKCLAEHPSGLIVDVCDADDPSGSSAALLVMAYRVGRAMLPRVPVAVCAAPGSPLQSRLRSKGAARFLPLFPTVSQARAALPRDVAVPDHQLLRLAPVPEAPQRARGLVTEAGTGWGLPHLVHPAELVMSELVTNVVQHVGTTLSVSVCRRGTGLYLAVRDGSTVLPPLPGDSEDTAGARRHRYGYGLWLVDQIAAQWGARPTHHDTGKVVWAVIRPGPPGRRADRSQPPPYLEVGSAEPTARPPLSSEGVLSVREQEILGYLPTMLTAEDIATRLCVSVNTIKAHLKSIYRKLGVSRRQEAVTEAIRRGLL